MFAPTTVIEGLRGVGRVELELAEAQRAYVLLGTNGVGKTKTLEALFQIALSSVAAKRASDRHVMPGDSWVFERATGKDWTVRHGRAGYLESAVTGSARETGLPVVFAGSQNRGFVQHARGSTPRLGTADERRERYVKNVIGAMASGSMHPLGDHHAADPLRGRSRLTRLARPGRRGG